MVVLMLEFCICLSVISLYGMHCG